MLYTFPMVQETVIMSTINKEVIDAFVSTLLDLTVNSKPLINVLTMIADENEPYSKNIVEAIETHLSKVRLEVKLPILYLIDCIIKNVGRSYTQHFCQNIVTTFCGVFQVVDEKTRAEMFKLRQTWNDVLPKGKLYAMDVQIRQIDPAWPITAHIHPIATNTIHVNPKFLNANSMKKEQQGVGKITAAVPSPPDPATLVMQQKLLIKQKELVELQQKKIELELLQTKVKLEEEKLKSQLVGSKVVAVQASAARKPPVDVHQKPHNLLLKPEVAKQLDNGCSDVTQPPIVKASGKLCLSSTHYTIPKHQMSQQLLQTRFPSTRDPRLVRLQQPQQQQQQQQTSNNITADSTAPTSSSIPFRGVQIDSNKKLVHYNSSPTKSKRPQSTKAISSTPEKLDKAAAATVSKISRKKSNSGGVSGRSKQIIISPASSNNSTSSSSSASGGSPLIQPPARSLTSGFDVEPQQGGLGRHGAKFRALKGANKRRNYVRRNNQQQQEVVVPLNEPTTVSKASVPVGSSGGDTDLRSLDSFVVVSTNERNQSPKLDLTMKGVDVDLRQIPTSHISSSSGEKKRNSSSSATDGSAVAATGTADSPPPAKKSKSQVLDALFGSEDVDLRQSTATSVTSRAATPPPPPPPIISTKSTPLSATVFEDFQKQKKTDIKKANLDALRAKLASVSNKEKLKEKQQERIKVVAPKGQIDSASLQKIIMSSEDVDSIKAGKLSKEQETAIMAKIKSHFENEKLAQAKLKEKNEEEQQKQLDSPNSQQRTTESLLLESDDDDDDEVIEVLPSVGPVSSPLNPSLDVGRGRFALSKGCGGLQHNRGMSQPWRGSRGSGTNRWEDLLSNTAPQQQQVPPWPQGNSRGSGGNNRWGDAIEGPDQHIIPPPPMPPAVIDITQRDHPLPIVLQSTSPSDARSINIDSIPRDIRFYNQTAIVFMAWDDPREISFQHGARRVIFDDTDVYLLQLNDPEWTEVAVSGQMHRARLGAPTRELWLDGRWYEAVFGGRSVEVEIDGRAGRIRLEGPPPQVRIGTERRTDLVVGKIQIIVDAKTSIPVFLDSLVQQVTFGPNQIPHQLQFVDALRAIRINGGEPIVVEFGGLPKPMYISQKKHFVRFSVLPRGVRPGYVRIQGMEGADDIRLLSMELSLSPELPHIPSAEELAGVPVAPPVPPAALPFPPTSLDENSQDSHHNLGGNFDALSNAINVSLNTSESEYNVEARNSPHRQQPQQVVQQQLQQQQTIGSVLNINDLFQKLLASGIVSTQSQQQQPQAQPEPLQQKTRKTLEKATNKNRQVQVAPVLLPVNWNKPDTLKMRQTGLVQLLYAGLQCSSCGERFPAATGGSRLFSQHLDWHFRQNRRGKNSNRKASNRRWYYSLVDWKQYEEIEDLRERAEKNFFENQHHAENEDNDQPHLDKMLDGGTSACTLVSVACDPDTTDPHCFICEDRFEQFYNEDLEEWHLRNAVSVDGQIYHPVCYKDQQAAANTTEGEAQIPGLDIEEDVTDEAAEESASVEEIQIIQLDDDDDNDNKDNPLEDVEVIETTTAITKQENPRDDDDDGDDDDVILNEVQPEQIILDEYEWRSGREPTDVDGLIPGVVVKVEPPDDGFMDVGDSLRIPQEPEVKNETTAEVTTITSGEVKATMEENGTEDGIPEEHDGSLMVVDEGGADDLKGQQSKEPTPASNAVIIEEEDVDMPQHQTTTAVDHPMLANIDGNIDMSDKTAASHGVGRIRINISKSHATSSKTATEQPQPQQTPPNDQLSSDSVSVVAVDPSQPLPPGEEPPLKPALRGLILRKQAPVNTGTELTGLCSIM